RNRKMSDRLTYKTNIWNLIQNLPLPLDRRVWQEAKSLYRAGFSVTAICPKATGYESSYANVNGIHIYRYRRLIEADNSVAGYFIEFVYCWLATLLLACQAYFKRPFHAIHACNPPDTFFLIGLLFRPLGVKFIFDYHDLCPDLYVAKGDPTRGLINLVP